MNDAMVWSQFDALRRRQLLNAKRALEVEDALIELDMVELRRTRARTDTGVSVGVQTGEGDLTTSTRDETPAETTEAEEGTLTADETVMEGVDSVAEDQDVATLATEDVDALPAVCPLSPGRIRGARDLLDLRVAPKQLCNDRRHAQWRAHFERLRDFCVAEGRLPTHAGDERALYNWMCTAVRFVQCMVDGRRPSATSVRPARATHYERVRLLASIPGFDARLARASCFVPEGFCDDVLESPREEYVLTAPTRLDVATFTEAVHGMLRTGEDTKPAGVPRPP